MAEKRKVTVNINGQEYSVIGEESEEYIQYLASNVDEKLKEILSSNSKLSQTMAAVLTSLTITDKYYKTYVELDELKESIKEPMEELEKFKKKSEFNKERFDKIKDENVNFKDELKEIKKTEQYQRKKLVQYEEALKLKEEEIQNFQKTINQLQNKLFENQIELVQTKKELDELMKTYDK